MFVGNQFAFGIQLQLIFTLFWLKGSCSLRCSETCFSISLRNLFPIFVATERWVKPDDVPFFLSTLGIIDACFLKF